MLVLALDTALGACSAALVEDGEALAARSETMERGHQERLAPLVAELVAEAGRDLQRLDRVAVTVGPGSFTGLRVGLAFAKGLALALDIPCVGVGTLEALAAGRRDGAAAVIDARRGQVFFQAFLDGAPLGDPAILPAGEAAARLGELAATAGGATVVGPGAALVEGLAGPDVRIAPSLAADPVAVARLAAGRAAETPRPLYLRAPDARTLAERAADR